MSTDFLRIFLKFQEDQALAEKRNAARRMPGGFQYLPVAYLREYSRITDAETNTSPLMMAVRLAPSALASYTLLMP